MKQKLLLALLALFTLGGSNLQAQTWTGNEVAAGDFYLYNVGQGKWLTSGNNWGTQATLTPTGGFCSTIELSEGKYAIKNTETRTNNKDNGPGYLGTNAFMDGESAAYFTFTAAERTDGVTAYYIQNGDQNLQYSGNGTVVNFGTETGDNAQWILVTKQNRLDAMAKATEDNPVDATFLLKNPDFGRYKLPAYDAAWTWTFPGGTNKNNAGDNTNFCVESYHVAFDFCQAVKNAPTGYYAVRGQAFYRQDGNDNTNLPYFYVGDQTVAFPAKTGDEGSMGAASTSFTAGNYQTAWSSTYTYAGGTLNVGTHLNTNTALWCIWDNIQIQYYGPIDLSEFEAQLAAAVSAAQAYESQLPAAVYANIESVITTNNKTWSTADEYSAAITAINNAVSTYATADIIADYARYNNVKTAALVAASSFDTTNPDNEVNAATTTDAIDAAIATLRAAFLTELPNVEIPAAGYIDVTAVMVDNASVRQNTDYWTIEGTPNTSYSWAKCANNECEFYQQNFKFYQTLALTPGTWEFGVTGFHRAGNHNTNFYAGEDKIAIPGVESSVVNSMAAAETYFDNGNGKVALKFLIEEAGNVEIGINNQDDTQTDKWTIFRDFTLKYYGAPDYSVYDTQWEEAVTAANAAIDANPIVAGEELTAVQTAIHDAPDGSSKANYLEKINALTEATATLIAAAPAYNAYAAEKTIAQMIGVTPGEDPTTAAAATTGVENLKVAEFNYVKDNYPYDYEPVIGTFGEWTATATVAGQPAEPNYLSNEHWSGKSRAYYEQAATGWGNAGGWTIKYEKTAKLPAGDYMLKVAARSSVDVTSLISCTATTNTVTLPNKGNSGRGIAKNGNASFADSDEFIPSAAGDANAGAGWEWRFLPFSLTEEAEVTMTFYAETNKQYNWMSIADGTLLSKQEIQNEVELTDADEAAPEAQVATSVITDRKLLEGLNTVIFPFETTATELGATTVLAYTGTTEEADGLTLNFKEVAPVDGKITLQANTPYAVMVDADQTENLAFGTKNISPSGELTVTDANNEFNFVGTYTNLAKGNEVVVEGDYVAGATAFKKAKGGNRIAAYRAYLKKVGTGDAKVAFNFDGNIVDGIEAIELLNKFSAEGIFNLQGQKVNNAQKGVYIVNGKKIVVK